MHPVAQRVQPVRVVERDDPDPSPDLVQQLVVHGASRQLRGRPRMRWAMMLRWICSDPPYTLAARDQRYRDAIDQSSPETPRVPAASSTSEPRACSERIMSSLSTDE